MDKEEVMRNAHEPIEFIQKAWKRRHENRWGTRIHASAAPRHRRQGFFLNGVIDPPRGRPFGGGGNHHIDQERVNNSHIIFE